MPDEQTKPAPIIQPPRTPKEKFQRGPHRKAHEQWTDTAAGQAAIEASLAEYVDNFDDNGEPYQATQFYNRLIGAKAVLRILANLHLPDEQPKQEPWPRLRPTK